jgi:hypothetical protein
MVPQTFEIREGAKPDAMGDANDGVCVETHIRQTVGPDWADRSLQQGCEVRSAANSQESRACATVDIRSTPAHRQALHTRILGDAAGRDWQLI